MREEDDVPLHVALALLCVVLLAIAVAAVNRHRIARFMNSGGDDWEPEHAVRCTVTGELARIGGGPVARGVMWGDYDCPPSPVAVSGETELIRDPLAEQLARLRDPELAEHIYQEIRPRPSRARQHNGCPAGLSAASEGYQ